MNWLPEHAGKYTKYQFGRLTLNYFEVTPSYLTVPFTKKTKEHDPTEKMGENDLNYFFFLVHWLAEHTPKSVKYRFTIFGRLNVRDPREGAKIILKLLFLTQRRRLIQHQRALSNREIGQK